MKSKTYPGSLEECPIYGCEKKCLGPAGIKNHLRQAHGIVNADKTKGWKCRPHKFVNIYRIGSRLAVMKVCTYCGKERIVATTPLWDWMRVQHQIQRVDAW